MVTVDDPSARTSLTRHLRSLRSMNAQLLVGVSIICAIVLIAVVVPLVWPYGPTEIVADDSLAPPSLHHLFGADNLGRDVFVRVADGYRISLSVAVGSILLALAVGVPLGLVAGYAGGVVDGVIMRPLDVLMAFPAILLAIVVTAILGTGTGVVMLAIGIVYIPVIARVMRASTLVVRREPYVEAARARGASHLRILVRRVLPNSIAPVIIQASLLMGIAILLEAALSFVGLGVRPPTPSLGLMLADGRDFLSNAPWAMSFNLIGDGLNRLLDPRGGGKV